MSKLQYTIRLDEDVFIKLKRIADSERRSVNNQVEYFIDKGISRYEEENGNIDSRQDAKPE
jgi:hypothetical protein